MFRNLSRRVEVVTPVTGRGLRERLWEILDVSLRDERQAWQLDEMGMYTRVASNAGGADAASGTHEVLMRQTSKRDLDETAESTVFGSLH